MKKITLLFSLVVPFAAFSQNTCATAMAVTAGTTVVASVNGTQLPTPDCSDDSDGVTAAVWYKYTATGSDYVTISSNLPESEEADTRLHVYVGSCGALACIGFNDDVAENYTSEVTFQAVAGTDYYFVWDDYYEDFGFSFSVSEFVLDCTATVPDMEDFSTTNSLCFTIEDTDGDGYFWEREFLDFDGDGVDETFFTNYYNEDSPKNDWLFTPAYTLTGGETYTITYTYNALDLFSFANETLEVLAVNAPSSTATFQQQLDLQTGITQVGEFEEIYTEAITQSVEFTPAASGAYNLAFRAMSPEFSSLMFLFNYTIEVSLGAPGFENGKIKLYPNPVVDELTITNENAIDSVAVYNLTGQKVAEQSFHTNEVKVDLSGLASGTYVAKIQSGSNHKTVKVIKQ